MKIGLPLKTEIFTWDTETWGQALDFWQTWLPPVQLRGKQVLELGAGKGGLSLYFGLQGAQVLCTDLYCPEVQAAPLHHRYGLHHITYRALNAAAMDLPDACMDIITFKSVAGGICKESSQDPRPAMFREIYRVLRPGGWLLCLENLAGSPIHMWLRHRFVAWAKEWRYLTLSELKDWLRPFAVFHYQTLGVLALCGRTETQRRILSRWDRLIERHLPEGQRYCIMIAAQKGSVF